MRLGEPSYRSLAFLAVLAQAWPWDRVKVAGALGLDQESLEKDRRVEGAVSMHDNLGSDFQMINVRS